MSALAEDDIYCGIHYPVPLHLQEAYKHLGYKQDCFPLIEKFVGEQVSLPMFAELASDQIEFVCEKIKKFCIA